MADITNLNEVMASGATRAVELAAEAKISLDYSFESICVVEQQLASLHEAMSKMRPSDAEIRMMAMTLGAYVGEVLRRRYGGYWSDENSLDPGTKIPTLRFANGEEIWPHVKVEKRLRLGPEDNVWHYAQVLMAKLEGGAARPNA